MKTVIYKTSKEGECFKQEEKLFEPFIDSIPPIASGGAHPTDLEANQIRIYPQVEYQTWQGFGASLTQSAAVAWLALPKSEQQKLIELYFSPIEGIGYNFCRLSIGSCDFSVDAYSYVDENDENLLSFDVSRDDNTVFYMVSEAQKVQRGLRFFASPWTPPRYMKTNNEWQGGYLKKEYYELWAEYFAKYVTELKKRNIIIEGVTVQNEPRHHQLWESCIYTPEQELEFVNEYLSKKLKPLGVKIYIYDHCKERVFERAEYAFDKAGDNIDGIACHWYSGDFFEELRMVREKWPNKEIIMSEGCCALTTIPPSIDKQWENAERYMHDIFGDLNNGLTSFCDWCITLDENRGPTHFRENRACVADVPIVSDSLQQKLIVQPSYYAIGHFSKFIQSGAKIIGVSKPMPWVEVLAAKNPDGSIIVVVYNPKDINVSTTLHIGNNILKYNLESKSIYTFVLSK